MEISLQNVTASFGKIAATDDSPFVFAFQDPQSGIIVTAPMDPDKCREFLQAALDSMGGVVAAPRPKLLIPGKLRR
jgi:hypothetical protein